MCPKRVILLSRHDVRRTHKKFWSRRFERADACYSHSASWTQKPFVSYFLDMMYFVFMKIFLLADSGVQMPVRLISASWAKKTVLFLPSRHDVRWVHENFLLADCGEKIPVRLISASWAQKRLIPTFHTWCTSSSWKIFFSPIPASRCLLDSFGSKAKTFIPTF